MKKTNSKEIVFNQYNSKTNPGGLNAVSVVVNAKKLLDTTDNSVATKIGAIILGEVILKDFKKRLEELEAQLEETPVEELYKALIKEGEIAEGDIPIFSIITNKGNKVSKMLTEQTKPSLNMDMLKDKLQDPKEFEKFPNEWKTYQNNSFFSSLYKANPDALGVYKDWFYLVDKTKTVLTAKKLK